MSKSENAPMGLTGRFFHVFGEGGIVQYQGVIHSIVSDRYALVQFYDWIIGDPNTMELVPLEVIALGSTMSGRARGSWQIYVSSEHMNEWYETHRKDASV